MKTVYYMLFATLFIISCNKEKVNKENDVVKVEKTQQLKVEPQKATNNGTYLCKINDKDWSYTKGSGIVSRDKKTGKRTAIITFKKQLEKGSESIQFYYDGDSFQLESAMIQLKLPKKGGGLVSGIYGFYTNSRHKYPKSDLSGTLNLSNPKTVSGNALIQKFDIKYEKELLENKDNAVISISDLNFSGIPYSDIDALFNK
ncbi:hypothetical protein JBL43_03145 [Aureibaculum sp. A20]|uniref:Uncharacterized protein n=1 Tax=Aureibaculum flavum TaxID=2795986 RepID=A0ABS0WMM4_9FLAO|nr:hypothetical protein [Aureibaculum flavum]MBJ2173215.1 hypothetical protein [Aureibaculum flavum]